MSRPAKRGKRERPQRWLSGAAALLGLFALGWIVFSDGMALRASAAGDSDTALRWDPHSGDLLTISAAQNQASGNEASARQLATRALAVTPLSPLALRILATTTPQVPADDLRLLKASSLLTWRDPATQQALILQELQLGRLSDAADHADALARTGGVDDQTASILDLIAMAPEGRRALVAHLVAMPPWRNSYLTLPFSSVASLLFRTALLDDLRSSAAPPTRQELSANLRQLVGQGFYQIAWNEWKNAARDDHSPSDPKLGQVQTGDDDIIPFEWTLKMGNGVAVDLTGPASQALELHASQNGSTNAAFLSKLIVLSPGSHTLSASARFSSPAAREAFQWQLACTGPSGEQKVLLRPQNGPSGVHAAQFEIPDEPDCPAVRVSLIAQQIDSAGPVDATFSRVEIL